MEESRFTAVVECLSCHTATARVISHESQPIADQVKRVYRCESCGTERTIFIDVVTREQHGPLSDRCIHMVFKDGKCIKCGLPLTDYLEASDSSLTPDIPPSILETCRVCDSKLPCNKHPFGENCPSLTSFSQFEVDALAEIIRAMWSELDAEGIANWKMWTKDQVRAAKKLAISTNDDRARDGILSCVSEAIESLKS